MAASTASTKPARYSRILARLPGEVVVHGLLLDLPERAGQRLAEARPRSRGSGACAGAAPAPARCGAASSCSRSSSSPLRATGGGLVRWGMERSGAQPYPRRPRWTTSPPVVAGRPFVVRQGGRALGVRIPGGDRQTLIPCEATSNTPRAARSGSGVASVGGVLGAVPWGSNSKQRGEGERFGDGRSGGSPSGPGAGRPSRYGPRSQWEILRGSPEVVALLEHHRAVELARS